MKKIYLFDHKISYKTFKLVMDKYAQDGITPVHLDKILWQMNRDRQIYVWIDDSGDPICIGTKLPKGEIKIIKNPA